MSIAADSSPPGEYYCPTCEKTFHIGERCPADGTRLMKLAVPIDPNLGRDLNGEYTILEKLGQGGMGAVYRAQQHDLGREVAIKVISTHLVTDKDVIKRFMREAKLASKLSHPNAVGVHGFGQTPDGLFYLVMELVRGRTLDQVFKAERQFSPARIVRIATQVCDALEGAHALQIVHRDLKPANIMLLAQGRDLVKVLDFGLAKSVAPDQTSMTMTNAGALVGTPAYMPPELALGQPCDGRADLYSLGCVLYLLGSGRLPFQSDSAHELIALHGTEQAPPMTGVPPALGQVIDRLLAKDPKDRYQSAAETREALEASIEGRMATPFPMEGTNPSIGPFPATTTGLFGAQTPVPPAPQMPPETASPSGRRRSLTPTAMDRLISSDTVAAGAATTIPPTPAPARPRWILPAAAGAICVAVVAVVLVAKGGSDRPAPTKPEPAATPIERPPANPATTTKPSEPDPKPVETATKPPDPDPKPVAPTGATKPKLPPTTDAAKLKPPKPALSTATSSSKVKPPPPGPTHPTEPTVKPKPDPAGPAKMPF